MKKPTAAINKPNNKPNRKPNKKTAPAKKTEPAALSSIIKRDGSIVPFDENKISIAVEKAMKAAGEFAATAPAKIAEAISRKLLARKQKEPDFTPSVEGVQD